MTHHIVEITVTRDVGGDNSDTSCRIDNSDISYIGDNSDTSYRVDNNDTSYRGDNSDTSYRLDGLGLKNYVFR